MDTDVSYIVSLESFAKIITIFLCLSKDNGLIRSCHCAKNFFNSIVFLAFINDFNLLIDIIVDVVFHITNLNVNRISMTKIKGKSSNSLRPSSREHKSLSIRSDLANDFSDGRFKTHIKHSIGFIENKISYSLQVDNITFQEINESTRSSNDNIAAITEFLFLVNLRGTTINTNTANFAFAAKFEALFLYLVCQFSGWSQN